MGWPEKAWEFVAFVSDDAFVAGAIAHLGYLGFCFAYAVDRRTGRHTGFQAIAPFGAGTAVAGAPDAGRSSFYHPSGYVIIENRPRRMRIRLHAFRFEGEFDDIRPWEATWPIRGVGYNRTQKAMGMPARGELALGAERLAAAGHGMLDWTRGVMARETSWRWSAGVGRAGGRLVAWNLRTGFDDPAGVENCVWEDGDPRPCGPAEIIPPAEGTRWAVRDEQLDMVFEEQGQRQESLDLLLVASRYRQPWGTYRGTYGAETLEGFGVAEDHWARW